MTETTEEELKRVTIGSDEVRSKILQTQEFKSIEEHQTHLKQTLAGAFRIFGYLKYDEGVTGHISVRDPGHPDRFWVNPAGVNFSLIKASDLLLVNHDGEVIEGNWVANTAAFAIHSRLHASSEKVNAVAHSHSPYGRAFSALGKLLDPISQDACMFYEGHALYQNFTGVIEHTSEGDEIAKAMGVHSAAILQNHGLITTGSSIETAIGCYIAMENVCRNQLLSDAAGTTKHIDHDTAIHTRGYIGSDLAKWASFQPMYQLVLSLDPSFLE